jgi:hypothetical protein
MKKEFTPPRLVVESSLTEVTQLFVGISQQDCRWECE